MRKLRAIIWLQCIASTFFVILAVCDRNQYYLPEPHNILVKLIAGLTILILLLLGLSIPFAIVIEGMRKRIPVHICMAGFALTLPFAVLQSWALMLMCT